MEKIGFIGIGIMGKPMVENLIKSGYPVSVYARREASLAPFKDHNIEIYPSPADLAEHCSVIISCVADTPDVEEVLIGEHGVLKKVQPGSLIIDMSTISAQHTRLMANQFTAKSVEMLDAPVSGGEIGATAGTLSIMVGGSDAAFARALPILQAMGENIIHVGNSGAGQIAKACNQILVAQTMTAVAEAYLLAQSASVDPSKVREALLGGFAYSKILEVHGQRMLDKQYTPGFKAKLHAKDLRIALENAKANGIEMHGAALANKYMQVLLEDGGGELDSAAIAKIVGSG